MLRFKPSMLFPGDLFCCHAIDNPSVESEMALLKQYGPDVSESVMRQLVGAFSELRELADRGLIQYPYSTREVVNIIKHLQVTVLYVKNCKIFSFLHLIEKRTKV